METIMPVASIKPEELLTSSEVELMETIMVRCTGMYRELLTSSEVELMETIVIFHVPRNNGYF